MNTHRSFWGEGFDEAIWELCDDTVGELLMEDAELFFCKARVPSELLKVLGLGAL